MVKSQVYGGRCSGLLAIYDQELQCWKTCQLSLFEEVERYLEALPVSGMMQNGQLYQLEKLVARPILDADGFLLPTPSASEHKYRLKGNSQQSKCLEAKARKGHFGKSGQLHPLFVQWMMGFPAEWLK